MPVPFPPPRSPGAPALVPGPWEVKKFKKQIAIQGLPTALIGFGDAEGPARVRHAEGVVGPDSFLNSIQTVRSRRSSPS